jgi:hypothetical protein
VAVAYKAVLDHPKFASLKALLKLGKAFTLGLLEALWHFTARYTPAGNVGKYRDDEIEAWLEWDGQRGACIAAFVACGWLDTNEEHRLLVHDWQDWADEYTHTILARKQERFANGDLPRTGRLNQTERKKFNEAVVANKVLSPKSEKLHSQPDSLTENSASGPLPYHTGVHTIPVTVPVPVPGPHAPNRVVAERQSDSALSTGVDDPAPFFAKVTLSPAEETAKWSASTYRDFWNGHVSADLRLTTIPKKWVQAIDGFRERRGLTPATFLEALKEMERTEPIQSSTDFYNAINSVVRGRASAD